MSKKSIERKISVCAISIEARCEKFLEFLIFKTQIQSYYNFKYFLLKHLI